MGRIPEDERDYDPLFVELRDYFFMFIVVCMVMIVAAIIFAPSRNDYPIRTVPTVAPTSLAPTTSP